MSWTKISNNPGEYLANNYFCSKRKPQQMLSVFFFCFFEWASVPLTNKVFLFIGLNDAWSKKHQREKANCDRPLKLLQPSIIWWYDGTTSTLDELNWIQQYAVDQFSTGRLFLRQDHVECNIVILWFTDSISF